MTRLLLEKMTLKVDASEHTFRDGSLVDEMGDFRPPEARIEDREKYYATLSPGFGESLAQNLHLRRFVTENESGHESIVLTNFGATESNIPGIRYTPHEMTIALDNPDDWKNLNEADRKRKFENEVLPHIENVVIEVHGWDGKPMVFLPYNAALLEKLQDPQKIEIYRRALGRQLSSTQLQNETALQLHNETALREPAMIDEMDAIRAKTLFISIGIMGTEDSLDPEKSNTLERDDIRVQILEAVDKLGVYLSEQKMKEITSNPWVKVKTDLLQKTQKFIENAGRENLKMNKDFQDLMRIMNLEERVVSGNYLRDQCKLLIGHSMGGNFILSEMTEDVFGNRELNPKVRSYWNKSGRSLDNTYDQYRTQLKQQESSIYKILIDQGMDVWSKHLPEGIKSLLPKLRQYVADNKSTIRDSRSQSHKMNHWNNAHFMAWMPVPKGNKTDVTSGRKWVKDAGTNAVPLSRNFLVRTLGLLYDYGFNNLRNQLTKLGRVIPLNLEGTSILDSQVIKHVGKGVPDPDTMYAVYRDGILNHPEFVSVCERILMTMDPPANDDQVDNFDNDIGRRTRIYRGSIDQTVSSEGIRTLEKVFRRVMGPQYNKVVKVLEGAGHHPREIDIPVIREDYYAAVIDGRLNVRDSINRTVSYVSGQMAFN